jgi:LysR family transcriptional regulator, low CO2-responsive transcriptional regulator
MSRPPLRRYFRHGLFPQLMVFEGVARLGSVTRAAQELHLAQPTVSTQIKKLSETLGVALFEQRGRQLHLTAAGRELLATCEELMDVLSRAEERLSVLRAPQAEVLRIAATPGARHLAARLLSAFCVRFPGVQASLRLAHRATLLESLDAGDDEIYLLPAVDDRASLRLQPVASESLFIYARRGHRLAKTRGIALETLADEVFVLREPGSSLRDMMLATFAARGLRAVVRAELAGDEAIAEAVAQGVGVALLPEETARSLVDSGAIVSLDAKDFPLRRDWGLAHARGRQLSPSAALFMREALAGELLGCPVPHVLEALERVGRASVISRSEPRA